MAFISGRLFVILSLGAEIRSLVLIAVHALATKPSCRDEETRKRRPPNLDDNSRRSARTTAHGCHIFNCQPAAESARYATARVARWLGRSWALLGRTFRCRAPKLWSLNGETFRFACQPIWRVAQPNLKSNLRSFAAIFRTRLSTAQS